MKLNFCTLFNSAYLSRGLAMFQSLNLHCLDFYLYIYAFDEECYQFFNTNNFDKISVIPLKEFETPDLLKVKEERTSQEYCWTCSSSILYHSITEFGLENCTYIDADMLFYSDPMVLYKEMGNHSVLISPHRYSPEYDQTLISGKYCVQFMTFKNTKEGMEVLNWWKDQCINWCYAKVEEGKFGDQKYVDDFQKLFTGVYESQHLGGGVAPWNFQQYTFENLENKILGTEKSTGKSFEVVYFHFHGLKFFENNIVKLTGDLYEMDKNINATFYTPYIEILRNLENTYAFDKLNFDPHGTQGIAPSKPLNCFLIVKFYLSGLKKSFKNIFGQEIKKSIAHHHYYSIK